ncbi:MAG: multidrug efflux RND transporter permease subunit [Victivallaceae bacterium]|nr:multidrug efflux RND transporter permease subunit [Victivallaceae bacterium]
MLSKFFIFRPRFAFVISIVLMLAGLVSIKVLPVAQYPNITPGQVQITATYPGADALTVQQTVIAPIEAQLNGVKRMLYISSTGTDAGSAVINVTFDIGTDGDLNTVNTQNRVNWADASLPQEVTRQGVIVKERSNNMLLVMTLYSPNRTRDALYLTNYALINIKDELSRIPGVGDVSLLGDLTYGMRIWLDTDRLAALNLTVADVTAAIEAQNVQVSAGAVGDSPASKDQLYRYTLQTRGRLTMPEEFKNIVLRTNSDGGQLFLGDVARIELGAANYASAGQLNGQPATLLAIYQLNDANGLEIAQQCKAKLAELSQSFPDDVEYGFQYDTTDFIRASISEVVVTLFEAVLLVILVTYLFLQDWRATLVPTVAIPVSLVGTFAVLEAIGYSINLITLFGLILAIGVVVDDAIVVIENVSRLIDEEKLTPKEAALKSMEQVTGPVIATTAVLLAMFVPVCFLSGITGEMYRQFGITISVAVSISSINALTLSPALSAILLRPSAGKKKSWFFRGFDWIFDRMTAAYGMVVAGLVRRVVVLLLCYGVLLAVCVKLFNDLPAGFIPSEDQGAFMVNLQLPNNAAMPRTEQAVTELIGVTKAEPGVKDVITCSGYSILTGTAASNNAMAIVVLDPWDERKTPELSQDAIIASLQKKYNKIPSAQINAIATPPIPGLGTTGGFSFVLEDTGGTDPDRMAQALSVLCEAANRHPALSAVFTTFEAKLAQQYLDINREKALKLDIPLTDINAALQGLMGYSYINDINKFGKVYKVEIQADATMRGEIADLARVHVRNADGEMVPLSTLLTPRTVFGPQYLNRYNLYSSATVFGSPAPGYSSGQAMAAMEEVAKSVLPSGFKFDWTDMSYQEREASGQIGMVFALALLFIYLFLVAQYESWMIPFAVLLSVPVALGGALLFLYMMNGDNNIYSQVGFVLLFGIACKTAILIVEFAKVQHEEGKSIAEAAEFAARLRFRAVLMTAVSFVLGTLPLLTATGAGAASRRALGMVVVGGMLLAVLLGTFMIPAFYVACQRMIEWRKK